MDIKKVIASSVVSNDQFTAMSHSSQALYFQFVIFSDEQGFCNSMRRCALSIGADADKCVAELQDCGFVKILCDKSASIKMNVVKILAGNMNLPGKKIFESKYKNLEKETGVNND